MSLLQPYLQGKDFNVADYRLLLQQPSFSQLPEPLPACCAAHAGFLVGLHRGRLLRRDVLGGPSLGNRPSALLSGRDQQDFDVVIPMR